MSKQMLGMKMEVKPMTWKWLGEKTCLRYGVRKNIRPRNVTSRCSLHLNLLAGRHNSGV